jgi:phage N-6-adenine-methyltransferase
MTSLHAAAPLLVETDERYTPSAFFVPLHGQYLFTLDVCATRESTKLRRYFTAKQDGLRQSWAGERCWCNPPYSNIAAWVQKAWVSGAELVVMLLPAWTDRDWWAERVEPFRDGRSPRGGPQLRTRFLRERIRFGSPGDPEGELAGRPAFGCVLLEWRWAP